MKFAVPKLLAPIAKRVAYTIIIVCSVLVVMNVAVSAYFNSERVVNRELKSLAEEYYEDYLYAKLIGPRTGDEIAKELERYAVSGVSPTYLRQLLLYDSGRRNEASKYFKMDGFTCDENETYVKYFPEYPYTNASYHYETKLVCN